MDKEDKQKIRDAVDKAFNDGMDFVMRKLRHKFNEGMKEGFTGVRYDVLLDYFMQLEEVLERNSSKK